MQKFSDMPFNRKIVWIVMATTASVLLLSTTTQMISELIGFKNHMVDNLATLGDVIGTNSTAALSFNDRKTAKEILYAAKSDPDIANACIFTKDGKLFARYQSGNAAMILPVSEPPMVEGHQFSLNYLFITREIILNNRVIGMVYLQKNLREFHSRLKEHLVTVLFILEFLFFVCIHYVHQTSTKDYSAFHEPNKHNEKGQGH